MARGFGSTDSVTDSRAGTDVRFGRGRVHAGGLSTVSIADSRTGEDVRFGRRVHARGLSTDRFASRTHGRERTVRFGWGESTREGG